MGKNIAKNCLYVLKKLIVKQTNWTAWPSLSREVSKLVLRHLSLSFGEFTGWIDPTNNENN